MEDIFKQSSNKFFIIKYKTRGQADQSLNNKVIFLQKRFDQQLRNAAQVCEQVGVFLSCLDQKSFIAFGTIQNEPTDFDYLTEEQQQNLSKLQEFFQSFVKVEWIFKGVLNFEKTKNIKNDLNEMKPVNHCKDVQELTCQTAEQLLSLLQKQKPYKPQPQQDIRIPHQLNNLLMKNFGENDSDKSSKSRSRHREKEKDKDKVQDKDRTKSSKENDRRSRDRKSKERSQRRSKENKKNSYEKKDYREDKSQNIQEFVIDDNKDQREKERQTRDKEQQKDKDQREHRERDRSKEQKDQREQREKEREKEQRQLKEQEKREREEQEMIEKLKQKEKEKEREREREKEKEREREKEKEKEKERDKDRDRERQRDKGCNREREKFDKGRYDKKDDYKYRDWKDSKLEYDKKEKGKERERERDKNREKSKERSFEKSDRKDRERRKEKERSRGDDKERDYNNHKRQKDYRRETIKKRSEERSKPRSRSKERNQDHNSNKNEKALDIASYSEQQRELFSSVSLQSHKYEQQQQDFELEESSKLPKQKDEVDLGDILNVLDSPKKNNQQFQPLIQPVIITQSEQLVLTKQSESYQSNNLNSDSKKRILVVNQEKNQSILDNVEQQKQQSSGSMKIIKDAPAKIIQQITNQQCQIQKSVVFQEAKQGSGNSIKDRIILKKK